MSNMSKNIPLTATQQYQRPDCCSLLCRSFLRLGVVLAAFYLYARSWNAHEENQYECERLEFPFCDARREELFLSVPNPHSARADARAYSSYPRGAGSSRDLDNAKATLEFFWSHFDVDRREYPIFPAGTTGSRRATLDLAFRNKPSAWIDIYYPSLSIPHKQELHILGGDGNTVDSLDLNEHGDPLDPESARFWGAVPAYHAYSHNGEVEGSLIYANYGMPEDYGHLEAAGANLNGSIILCRAGITGRDMKVREAQERGAIGVLIYPDTRDDRGITVENGYAPYPYGPARNPTAIERGSVMFLASYFGDPTTPGYPSYENATRVQPQNLPNIPSLPISWANGVRLLNLIHDDLETARVLSGKKSALKIRLVNHVSDEVLPIWNAMAAIPGRIRDEVIIIANHRDAWIMGAADPGSANIVWRQIIRGFGVLMQNGWRPLRTVVFASWDGEEAGAIGSTEWGEDFAEWISEHVVAYLNVDTACFGSRWDAAGTPSLSHLIKRTALDVPHSTVRGKTLWDARWDQGPFPNSSVADFVLQELPQSHDDMSDPGLSVLGGGSDYTVMLQHLGVPSIDQGFEQGLQDAVWHYHSVYDSPRWQEMFADPGFDRHIAVTKHHGLLALRFAESIILPINTTHYAYELDVYLDRVVELATALSIPLDVTELRKSIGRVQTASLALDEDKDQAEKDLKRLLRKFAARRWRCRQSFFYRATVYIEGLSGIQASSWWDAFCAREGPGILDPVVWNSHEAAADTLKALPRRVRELIQAIRRMQNANRRLTAFERGLISKEGLKGKQWFRHLVLGPGKEEGYSTTTFPGLTEALELEKNVTAAEQERDRLKVMFDQLAVAIH